MGRIGKELFRFSAVMSLLICAAEVLYANSAPNLNQAYVGAVIVSGSIAPRSGPVTIFDLSFPARTQIGVSNSIDTNGNFAASVNPPLIANHQIVAVDANGATSQVMVVAARPSSPAGPGK